jgi:hypothetical protein
MGLNLDIGHFIGRNVVLAKAKCPMSKFDPFGLQWDGLIR